MLDTDDLEFDDPEIAGIDDDELPDDEEELGEQPAPATAIPAEPVSM
jgi:hypothetical protein